MSLGDFLGIVGWILKVWGFISLCLGIPGDIRVIKDLRQWMQTHWLPFVGTDLFRTALVILGIALFLLGQFAIPKMQAGKVPTARPSSVPLSTVITERTPNEVLAYIATLPPLLQEATLDSVYVGSWVHWSGRIAIIRREETYYLVGVSSAVDTNSVYTTLEFDLGQRATVEPLREGDSLAYVGRISEIIKVPIARTPLAFVVTNVRIAKRVPRDLLTPKP